ncbi:MAG: phosphatase PAP2 family protein [Pseudomonadota bacterium]
MIRALVVAFALVTFTMPAWAGTFYPKDSLNSVALIGPPAEPGSAEFDQEMFAVLWLQESRTPEQVAFVQKSVDLERFAPVVATSLVNIDTKALSETLEQIISEVRDDYNAVKERYDIPRPFVINEQVDPVADAFPVTSYPSGHTIRAIVYTSVLSDLFPDHAEELIALGTEIGYGRVIGGVHYPMDVVSGQRLGHAYMDVIRAQPAYQEALEIIQGSAMSS